MPLTATTDLTRVHAHISSLAGEQPILYERDLESYLAAMIESGIVSIEGATAGAGIAEAQDLAQASLEAFVRACSLYFERLPDDERARELGRRFLLRDAPRVPMPIRFSFRWATSTATALPAGTAGPPAGSPASSAGRARR